MQELVQSYVYVSSQLFQLHSSCGAPWIQRVFVEATCQEVVHWRCNSFKTLHGNVTKKFVFELARLF